MNGQIQDPWNPNKYAPDTNQRPVPSQQQPKLPLSHQQIAAIKNAPKGKLPPGLAKYWATHKRGKKGKK